MDVTPDAALRTPPGFDKAVRVSEIMSAMRPGWSALHDCVLPGMDELSAARVALVLLHPAVGVAVVNIGTEPIPDGVARVRRKLRLAGFEARFPGWLPVVQRPVPATPLALLESLLDRTFQLEEPLDLPGGDAWVRAACEALSGGSTPGPTMRLERASAPAGLARRSTADPQPTLPAAAPERSSDRRARPGLAGLLWFWMAVITVGGAGAAVLQVLGPPEPAGHPPLAALAPPQPSPQTPPPVAAPTVSPAAPVEHGPDAGGPPHGSDAAAAATAAAASPAVPAPVASPAPAPAIVPAAEASGSAPPPDVAAAPLVPTSPPDTAPSAIAEATPAATVPPSEAGQPAPVDAGPAPAPKSEMSSPQEPAQPPSPAEAAAPSPAVGPAPPDATPAATETVPPAAATPVAVETAPPPATTPAGVEAAPPPPAVAALVLPPVRPVPVPDEPPSALPALAPAVPPVVLPAPAERLPVLPPSAARARTPHPVAAPPELRSPALVAAAGATRMDTSRTGATRTLDPTCRNILGRAQLGEELTDDDRAILRAGCKAHR